MAFNMKGSPAKMGTIKGTKGHTTALKWAQFIPAALSVLGSMSKKKDEDDSPAQKRKVESTKPPKVRTNPESGKQEMHTGYKTNPITGKKTETYSAY